MRILITGTLIFIAWSIFSNYWYVCKIRNLCGDVERQPMVVRPEYSPDTLETAKKTINEDSLIRVIENSTFYFEFDSTLLLNKEMVFNVTDPLKKLKPGEIIVEGHTCNIGTNTYNYHLGIRRATKIKNELNSEGIRVPEMEIVSRGETEPALPNTSEQNRIKNRRVKILIKQE